MKPAGLCGTKPAGRCGIKPGRGAASPGPVSRSAALGAAALAAALAGCGSMAPPYERPPAPVAAAFPDAGAASGPVAADLEWQAWLGDARLRRLVALALDGNRDLRAAVAAIEQARQRALAQGAAEGPTVNAAAAMSRTPTASGGVSRSYSAGLAISSWEIDFFGRLRSLTDAAQAQALQSEAARQAVQVSLVAQVIQAGLALMADDEALALASQTLQARLDSLKLVELRAQFGVTSELDLQATRSLVEAARASLAQLQRQRAQDENLLVLLVGQSLPPDLPPPATLGTVQLGPDLPAGLPATVLARRPDVRQAEAALVAANANIGAARAAMFPQILLTTTAGTASSQLSGLLKSGSWGFTLAPQALLAIFDGGRNRANLAAAQAAREQALAAYEKSLQSAFREVADALAGRQTFGEQFRAQQAQAEAEAARYQLTDLRYRNGVASALDLLDAQRSLYAAQQAALQVRLAGLQNQVALYRTLGGGWRDGAP